VIAATATAVTPSPPGRIGAAISPQDALHYLEALGTWRDQRKVELDLLDEAALSQPDGDSSTGLAGSTGVTGDVML